MTDKNANRESHSCLEALYPELTREQREEAAYHLSRYLDTVQRIFERVERERNLTDSEPPATI